MLERILLKAAVQLVLDDVLLAAARRPALIGRREQFKQVRTAAGQDDAVGRYLPLVDLNQTKNNQVIRFRDANNQYSTTSSRQLETNGNLNNRKKPLFIKNS